MQIADLKAYNQLQFCPVCGKNLEIHPNTGWKTCFVHGDFLITTPDSDIPVIEWDYLPI